MKKALFALLVAVASTSVVAEETTTTWSFSQFGQPLYHDAPSHFNYANPDAPKGGRIVLSESGSFDTLNYMTAKGTWPSSVGLLTDSLMVGSEDELDAYYGLIAETVEFPEDISWATFKLRPEAKYHDGSPVTAKDFVYALKAMKEKGRPWIKSLYESIERAEAIDDHTLKFYFNTVNTRQPLSRVAEMSPRPADYWENRDITAASLEPPKTSGPYRIKKLDAGRFITYERVKDYWAKDLPLQQGLYNFDEIHYDFYRDETVRFEAFKSGQLDIRQELSAKRWVKEYDTLPQIKDGRIVQEEVPTETPKGLYGLYFNMASEKYQNLSVREALVGLYDFETVQRLVFYGKFERLKSYFNGDNYRSSGIPEGRELTLLEPYRDQLPERLFTQTFELPVTDGSGRDRKGKRRALGLFKKGGMNLSANKLVDAEGTQFTMKIMTGWPDAESFLAPYVANLKSVGIDAEIRVVHSAQWRERVRENDYDIVALGKPFVVPPGTELASQFGSESAETRGANSSSIRNPVVDALVEDVAEAKTKDELEAAVHALDRVLLWSHYAVPLYFRPTVWVAYWDKFERPVNAPRYALGISSTWWASLEAL